MDSQGESSTHTMDDNGQLEMGSRANHSIIPSDSIPEKDKGAIVIDEALVQEDQRDPSVERGDVASFKGKRDPFSNPEAASHFKTMSWWHAGMVMIAETISLGILSLPKVLAVVGFVPGLVLIIGLGVLATYTGYVLGQFKAKYPHIHNMADAGEVLGGAICREFFGACQVLFFIFVMGSHILTFAIMMNSITEHGACTVIWSTLGLVISIICTLPRTLKNVAYMSITSFISIGSAVLVTMIGVAMSSKSETRQIHYFTDPNFHEAFQAVCNIVFAYAGHIAFFGFITELKNPKDYPKALCLLQVCDITMYLVAAIVIYWYGGNHVASPALDSTSPLLQKIAYGLAAPTIIVSGVINGHVATKYCFVRALRPSDTSKHPNRSKYLSGRSLVSFAIWAAIATTLWIIAFLVAESIPVFNDLLGITSALFASWFTYGLAGVFWLHLNKGGNSYFTNWKKGVLTIINVLIVLIGGLICIGGLYASVMNMKIHAIEAGDISPVFSCRDNSN